MKSGKIGIIIQARMRSTRLPGKVLKLIEGKPMLWHIIERLKQVKQAEELVVATSVNIEDRAVVELAERCGITCFIGSAKDVLDRYYQAAREFRLEHIVRATGDNPLVDPEETDRLIGFHRETGADYSSNKAEVNSGLPDGIGLEVFSFASLARSWGEGKSAGNREHVNEYVLNNRDSFNVKVLPAPENKRAPHLRLTVDTPEDFTLMTDIYRRFYVSSHIVPVEQVVEYLVTSRRDSGDR